MRQLGLQPRLPQLQSELLGERQGKADIVLQTAQHLGARHTPQQAGLFCQAVAMVGVAKQGCLGKGLPGQHRLHGGLAAVQRTAPQP